MNQFKFFSRTALSCALVISTSVAAYAGDITLKLAGVVPVDHFGNAMLEQIASDIEAADVGLSVKIFPAGQLGSGEELLEDAIRGNVDIVHAFVYAHKDPALEINSLPFLVSTWDELESVYGRKDSAYNQIMDDTLDRIGLKLLGSVAEGFVGVVTTEKPDNYATIGDKGVNIRVWSSQIAKSVVEAIGFNATTMNFGEVFAALQSGAVDGAICCTSQLAYTAFAQSDIGEYFIPYNAFVESTTYYASAKTWEKLNDEQRAVVEAAVDRAAADFIAKMRADDDGYLDLLREKGWEVLELSDDERAAMIQHVQVNVWPSIADIVGQDAVDRLIADK